MPDAIDWVQIAERFGRIQAEMIHHEHSDLCGNEFYAEALRRAFYYQPARDGHGPERISPRTGLTTIAEANHLRDAHTTMDRLNREAAEKQVKEMRAEVARVYLEARTDIANIIRSRCNERSVPAKYRREGVELAADWIDPAVPKDRYGNIVKSEKGD
jgi:hypothetical protein